MKFKYNGRTLSIAEKAYSNNDALAIQIVDVEDGPFATLSTNVIDDDEIGTAITSDQLPKDCFYAKHWSENADLFNFMVRVNIIERQKEFPLIDSGFIDGIGVYKLNRKYPSK